jgi:hypothetical protein
MFIGCSALNIMMFNLYENCASPVPAVKNKKA